MKKIRNQFNRVCGVFAVRAMEAKRKLAERSGEGYVDTAVKILIAVVLGALLLAGLYPLPDDRCRRRWQDRQLFIPQH